ncbi:CmcJ/NvfI family oxidoreductase [Nocardioides sp. WS12]|uniref:CmcJ/NvfI family oxidoreductase n=1 Tax=Nocardioides sp. WS12 TaxID=2486272 RepID=UPI0015F7D54B|nr:CmcJ/NvfI family oxidoreductase [Nocardioides sp. WS12]
MSASTSVDPHLRCTPSVTSVLTFHDETPGRTYFYTYVPPEGVPRVNGNTNHVPVLIRNGWELGSGTLETHGFEAGHLPTRFTAWDDAAAICDTYRPEVEAQIAAITGASRVVSFDHNVRCDDKAQQQTWANTSDHTRTARWVHNDYTPESARERAAEILGYVPHGRFAFINLWRPIREPLRDTPLAVCDGQTIRNEDLERAALIYPEREGEYFLLRHHVDQRWYWFPEMRNEEALLLKCMDTAASTRFSAHSAFDNPDAPAGSPPRESIEVRVIAVWDDNGPRRPPARI